MAAAGLLIAAAVPRSIRCGVIEDIGHRSGRFDGHKFAAGRQQGTREMASTYTDLQASRADYDLPSIGCPGQELRSAGDAASS